jgi:hypothetical protein
MNIVQNFFTKGLIVFYLALLFFLPLQWHKISSYGEIFPALDIIIIYYIMTYYYPKNWHLFIYGIFVDKLYNFPLGSSALILILSYQALKLLSHWFVLRDYFTNLVIFYAYSFLIILSRYILITIKSPYSLEGIVVLFYFLTTISAYPLIYILIKKPIQKLHQHAR